MSVRKPRRERPPLNAGTLNDLALRYVGRFATTRAKLCSYLERKVRERGWDGPAAPDLNALAERFAAQNYVDDAGYALAKSRSLSVRGYGKGRLVQSLRVAGVADDDAEAAHSHADEEAVAAAIRFARRKRIGPFATEVPDPKSRERSLAAMIRAGHAFALCRTILALPPGTDVDADGVRDSLCYSADN